MLNTTVGQLLVNDTLPDDLRDYNRKLDAGGVKSLLAEVARKHPEQYRDVSFQLNQIGWRAAQDQGGMSFGMRHLRRSKAAQAVRQKIQAELDTILADDSLTDKQRAEKIIRTVGRESSAQQKAVLQEALDEKNPLALQVTSGTRGKPMNLASLIASDMLYADHRDEVIPIPVLRSYSEGLTPEEYWAGTYGARRGIIATKFATQEAGFLSKQLNQAGHRLVVVDEEGDDDPTNIRGLVVDTEDMDNEGALLAQDTGPYKRNTPLTPKILKHLNRLGKSRILVRSPMVGGSPEGGVYARDVGIRETGKLPGRGEQVGLQASQALSEPISQGQLSAKHSGGVAGQEKAVSGFQYINQLIQVPKKMPGGATHATVDGTVQRIEEAPAGGYYITVNDERHYVPPDMHVRVKKGDNVEAGDLLTDGIPNPSVITQYKGVGEGRRYFVSEFKKALASGGMSGHRRNVELLARGLINHVKLTEEFGDNVPDDVIPYSTLEHTYKPREGFSFLTPSKAVGQYLEKPVLHYTIGTKIRPSMLKDLEEFGVKGVTVHKNPPPFEPHMVRGMYQLQYDPDWMTQMYGSGLKKSLLDSVAHGNVSEERGTSFVPSLAVGTDFGEVPDRAVIQPKKPYELPKVEIPEVELPKFASYKFFGGKFAPQLKRADENSVQSDAKGIGQATHSGSSSGLAPSANSKPTVNSEPWQPAASGSTTAAPDLNAPPFPSPEELSRPPVDSNIMPAAATPAQAQADATQANRQESFQQNTAAQDYRPSAAEAGINYEQARYANQFAGQDTGFSFFNFLNAVNPAAASQFYKTSPQNSQMLPGYMPAQSQPTLTFQSPQSNVVPQAAGSNPPAQATQPEASGGVWSSIQNAVGSGLKSVADAAADATQTVHNYAGAAGEAFGLKQDAERENNSKLNTFNSLYGLTYGTKKVTDATRGLLGVQKPLAAISAASNTAPAATSAFQKALPNLAKGMGYFNRAAGSLGAATPALGGVSSIAAKAFTPLAIAMGGAGTAYELSEKGFYGTADSWREDMQNMFGDLFTLRQGVWSPVYAAGRGLNYVFNPIRTAVGVTGTAAQAGGAGLDLAGRGISNVASGTTSLLTGTSLDQRMAAQDRAAATKNNLARQAQRKEEQTKVQQQLAQTNITPEQRQALIDQAASLAAKQQYDAANVENWKKDETENWRMSGRFRDNIDASVKTLDQQIAALKADGSVGNAAKAEALQQRKNNYARLGELYRKEVGMFSSGQFDDQIRNSVTEKKRIIAENTMKLQDPTQIKDPAERARLESMSADLNQELTDMRSWAGVK